MKAASAQQNSFTLLEACKAWPLPKRQLLFSVLILANQTMALCLWTTANMTKALGSSSPELASL